MSKNSEAVKIALIGLIGTIVVALIAIVPDLMKQDAPPPNASSPGVVSLPPTPLPEEADTVTTSPPAPERRAPSPTTLVPPSSVNEQATPGVVTPPARQGSTFNMDIKENKGVAAQGTNIRLESVTIGTTEKRDTTGHNN